MQELPNARGAIIQLAKIRDYCVSPDHPRGRHKARVFREALGLAVDDAEWLRHKIMDEFITFLLKNWKVIALAAAGGLIYL